MTEQQPHNAPREGAPPDGDVATVIGFREPGLQVESAVTGVALAGALAVMLAPGAWDVVSTVLGVIFLMVLHGYAWGNKGSRGHNFAFSAAWGLCVILVVGPVFNIWWPVDREGRSREDYYAADHRMWERYDPLTDYESLTIAGIWFAAFAIMLLVRTLSARRPEQRHTASSVRLPSSKPLVAWIVLGVAFLTGHLMLQRLGRRRGP